MDRGGLSPRLQLVDPGTRQDFDGDHVGVEGFQPLQKVEDQRGAEALAEGSEVKGSQDHDLRPLDLCGVLLECEKGGGNLADESRGKEERGEPQPDEKVSKVHSTLLKVCLRTP